MTWLVTDWTPASTSPAPTSTWSGFAAAGDHAGRVIAVSRATGQPAFIPLAFMVLAWSHCCGELADCAAAL